MSKISELSDGGSIQGGDTLIAVRSGGNVKVTYGGSTTANIDGGTIDGTVIGGTTPAAVTTTALVATTADINAGTIDGTVIGGTTAAAITGTTITGTSFVSSGDMTFGDSDKAIFGAGSDLQIYHDGSNSFISEVGTGNLQIQGQNLSLEDSTGSRFFLGIQGGETRLYNQNNQKVAVTATGIDVTGTVTADGLTISSTENISFTQTHTDGNVVTFTQSGTGGDIDWRNANGSALIRTAAASRLLVADNGDISFYEDTGTTPKFFWDASAESLGIGTSSPAAKLEIGGAGEGIILASPDDTRYEITVANGGTLTVTAV